jgi:dTDP-4-amino-4,6-dideoxygalactose transaminase
MRSTFLDFSPPLIGEEEVAEVIDTLRSGWITTGPRVLRFEKEFAAFLGAPGALALNSATAALHVALVVSEVGPGDVVITTPMTFCSCVHVIEHVGARPLLVDVEPDTLNIDPAKVERAIEGHRKSTGRLRAILPVHLYGHPADMDPIVELAREHELAVIEDAAHALPARYHGRIIGSGDDNSAVSRIACFSFYATKNLTTGEGGMLVASPAVIEEARVWSLHGMSRDAYRRYTAEGSWFYDVIRPGFKYNMPDIQAAIGLHQLRKLSEFQTRRREIVRRYHEAFRQYEELQIPVERRNVEHAWHVYALRLNADRFRGVGGKTAPSIVRNAFIERLKIRNIGTSVHFIPIHVHRYYREKYGYQPEDFPVAFEQYNRLLSLPLYPRMSDADVGDVIQAVRDVVETWDQ